MKKLHKDYYMNIQVGANAGNISQNSMCKDRVQCGRYSVHATRKILEALRSYFSLVQRGCQKNS